jgi:hypothetical protein
MPVLYIGPIAARTSISRAQEIFTMTIHQSPAGFVEADLPSPKSTTRSKENRNMRSQIRNQTTAIPSETIKRRLSAGGLKPLADLVNHLRLSSHFKGDAVLHGAVTARPGGRSLISKPSTPLARSGRHSSIVIFPSSGPSSSCQAMGSNTACWRSPA